MAYRASEGVGLAEAKSAVERWVDVNLPPPPDYTLAVRAAERLHARLQEYATRSPGFSYTMCISADRRDRYLGHPTLLAGHVAKDHSGRQLEVLLALSDVPKRFWSTEVLAAQASGIPVVIVVEVEFVEPAVTVYVTGARTSVFLNGATFDCEPVLPGFTCSVAELFA